MPDNRYNDENLSKLSEEYAKNKKKDLSQFNNDEFEEFFGGKSRKQTQKSDSTPVKPHRNADYAPPVHTDDYEQDAPVATKPAPQKKTGLFSGFMYFVFIVSVSIILACVLWIAASDVLALNKKEMTAEIVLPQEIFTKDTMEVEQADGTFKTVNYNRADMGKVASILKENGIIEYKSLFMLYASFSHANQKLDPGTYELSTIYDYRAIVKKMQFGSGAMVQTEITFPEGMTVLEVFELLEKNKVCTVDDLKECAATLDFGYSFLEDIPYGDYNRLEGYLFPDTYYFYEGSSAQMAINTFLQIFNARVTAEIREQAAASGYSLRDILNIASMIEKEAANDEERATISGVIYNRLKQKMYLGIDATSVYSHQDYDGDDVTSMIATWTADSSDPYNTRTNLGLPPTPISNPGLASIKAALNPEKNNYLYYALDEATKTHRFFTNQSEFNAFTATQSYGQ